MFLGEKTVHARAFKGHMYNPYIYIYIYIEHIPDFALSTPNTVSLARQLKLPQRRHDASSSLPWLLFAPSIPLPYYSLLPTLFSILSAFIASFINNFVYYDHQNNNNLWGKIQLWQSIICGEWTIAANLNRKQKIFAVTVKGYGTCGAVLKFHFL